MNINDKIKQILIDKNYSPSYFADEIGVQRSSISHILSGRNRPSFDIIQKIIRRFPELGYEWIMEEDNQTSTLSGNSFSRYGQSNNPAPQAQTSRHELPGSFQRTQPTGSIGTNRTQRNEIAPAQSFVPGDLDDQITGASSAQQSTEPSQKKVERILIFYSDGSFREYTPAVH